MSSSKLSTLVFFVAILILSGYNLQAQSQKKIELVVLLTSLENKFEVSFNYLHEDLKNIEVFSPGESYSLEEALGFIKKQLPLSFTFISEQSVAVNFLHSFKCLSFFDATSGKSIADVQVIYNKQTLGFSNSFGKVFVMDSVDLGKLHYSHPNYFNVDGSFEFSTSEVCEIFYLYPEIELDEIIIKEYLTKGIYLNSDHSLKIIPQEFGVLPGLINADVLHSLQYVPGIVNTNETIAQINVRGGTHDQNLILWNGSRMYQSGHFFGMISAINPLINHQIKVIKNGGSAFFNEGVSSVIDISSREHSQDYRRIFQLDFLSANAAVFLELNDNSDLQIAARKSLTDVFESPTYKGYTDKVFQNTEIQDLQLGNDNRITTQQELKFFDVSLQYAYEFNADNRLNFDVLAIQNQLTFDEVLETTSEQKRNDFEQGNFLANLSYKTKWNKRHSTAVAFNASFYRLEAFNQSVLSNQEVLQVNQVLDLKFSLKDSYKLSEYLHLDTGYQFNEVGVRNDNEVTSPEVILREKRVLTTHSGIAELEYNSRNKKLRTRLGIRGNLYSDFEDIRLEPRFNLSYQANRYWRWNVLGEIKNQTLTQVIDQQQDFLGVEKRRWILADEEDFPIINSQQIEVGVNFNKKGWLVQSSVYHKVIEGISTGSQGFQNQLEFLQLNGDYEVIGVEFLVQKQIDDFNFWFNFSLMDNTYDFKNFSPQQFANNFEITQSSAFGINYTADEINLSLGGRYFAGRPTTEIDTENPILTPDINPELNFLSPNASNLKDYFQLNLTASYQFQLKHSSIRTGFSILNLFNSTNLTQQFFRLNDFNTSVENVRIKSLEFTPNVFISFQF
ncbi:TonB-dependent receptor plug domain-containing protein [Psychroflexus sediminis]|uniref:Outer membrane receptor for ferrienterochelin and colicins n=1 Tax=Psychroflexus sediminis TaxID=470826 RepID=A0A1G7WF01_9FLAO|nr:TonB-dependent receptor plug domain-containing protein [Psychroflexus sediminis]SDG69750.1 Outer membrane receptor for ferrienterochelin and colicins [Psychroflexus sediminis]